MNNRRFLLNRIIFILPAFLFLSVTSAMAQVSFTDDKAQFLADHPGVVHQNFESGNVPAVSVFNICSPPEDFQSNDNCFSPGDILKGIVFTQDPFDVGGILLSGANLFGNGNPPAILTNNTFLAAFVMEFIPGVSSVGMDIGCIDPSIPCVEDVIVQVFGVDGLIDSTVVSATGDFDTFLGISSAQRITGVLLFDGDTSDQDVRGVLNVWFEIEANPIPTLSEWGMIAAAAGLMVVGVFFAVRRRQTVRT